MRAKVAKRDKAIWELLCLLGVMASDPGQMAMKRLIDLLDADDHRFFKRWADANVAVFSSALLVEILRGIVDLFVR